MDSPDYLTQLRRELDIFATYLHSDLSLPIEHCGDWTLYDLADHIGRGNLWAAAAVTEKRSDNDAPAAPRDPAELLTWFNAASAVLLTTLDTDPATEAWTFFPPHTVGFWQRRRCLETLVHRWDVEHALGIPSELDPALADDGIAEVIDTQVPRQVKRGRATAPTYAIRFAATDTGSAWVLGPGDPVATVKATAPELLLVLWRRLDYRDTPIAWEGDREAAQAVLDGPLVP